MTGKRWYDDACGMAQGLNLVGDRWALHVVRELLLGPKRFADLRGDLPGVSSNVLSQRLEELEERSIVARRRLPAPVSAQVYELTEWGAELEPVITRLGMWAARSPSFDRDAPLSCSSAVLSMRTMFRAELAEGVEATVGFELGDLSVLGRIADGGLSVSPATRLDDAGAVLAAAPETVAALLYDGRALDEAIAAGDARLEGDPGAFATYAACFRLPDPAP